MNPFIAFDMGNVLLPFDHMRACSTLATAVQLPADTVYSLLFTTGLVRRYELGELSSSAFAAACEHALGCQIDPIFFKEAWSNIFTEDKQMLSLVAALATKADLCLISNTNEYHFNWVAMHFPVISYFRHRVLSYEVHAMKPDGAIFLAASRQIASGQTAAFIDDIAEHAVASERFGFVGLQFTGYAQLLARLEMLGML